MGAEFYQILFVTLLCILSVPSRCRFDLDQARMTV
jgi:hypothetical protein